MSFLTIRTPYESNGESSVLIFIIIAEYRKYLVLEETLLNYDYV